MDLALSSPTATRAIFSSIAVRRSALPMRELTIKATIHPTTRMIKALKILELIGPKI
ncbi:hypothetical protein ASZ90_014215 [hydrocarbon metagenome]|jgi:hypothetical protein|uniref:Uncharacterized protein n=1 Tax=hydrocarbon metagenome TaxID=938273 RepID=A0A0W8F5C9_9ZZZZ